MRSARVGRVVFSVLAFRGAAVPYSLRVELSPAPVSVAGFPGTVAGTGDDGEAKSSWTANALQALAGARWMITRHIGLFCQYRSSRMLKNS